MQELPHHYAVAAFGKSEGDVRLVTEGVADLSSAPPVEFGGPGGRWSPESLLVAAVADCFVLSFRAVARASKMPWSDLHCAVTGTLDRADGKTRFTEFTLHARLVTPPDVETAKAVRLLEKAESVCLISNSLSSTMHLTTEVTHAG